MSCFGGHASGTLPCSLAASSCDQHLYVAVRLRFAVLELVGYPFFAFLILSANSTATTTQQGALGFLPPGLQAYSSIITAIVFFIDGLIVGAAVKKGALSFVLIVIGLLLASYFGLSITTITVNELWTHLVNIFSSQVRQVGAVIYGIPILWLLGFLVGIWKG